MEGIIRAWGRILAGYQPNLSIEITRECPLTCPGCYAYGDDHLGGDVRLRELQDFKGQELVDAMFALLEKYKPLHVSIVGGEPLVRYRELNEILPRMAEMGIYTQVVTSAVRRFRSSGPVSGACSSSSRSTGCSPSTTSGASPPPTSASSSTSRGTTSPSTARSRASRCGATGTSKSSRNSGRRTRRFRRCGSACTRRRSARFRPSG